MNLALIIVAFIVAAVGLYKRNKRFLPVTLAVSALLWAGAVTQILLDLRKDKAESMSNHAGSLTASVAQASKRDASFPLLKLGDGGSIFDFSGPQGQRVIKFIDENALTVGVDKASIKVSTLIRDNTGSVVAELVDNEWKVNDKQAFDRNYSKNALEVKDNAGDVVLQVVTLPDRIELQGRLYDCKGNGITIGKDPRGQSVMIEAISPAHHNGEMKIKPIFLYPSENHLGEMVHDIEPE